MVLLYQFPILRDLESQSSTTSIKPATTFFVFLYLSYAASPDISNPPVTNSSLNLSIDFDAMVEVIDISEDGDTPWPPGSLSTGHTLSAVYHGTAMGGAGPSKQNGAELPHMMHDESSSYYTLPFFAAEHRPYTESFYIDFVTTMERSFPWRSFAARYRLADNELRHIFFVLFTLPLANPEDNSKKLKVAEGARNRFGEWRKAWKETVGRVREEGLDQMRRSGQKRSHTHGNTGGEYIMQKRTRLGAGMDIFST